MEWTSKPSAACSVTTTRASHSAPTPTQQGKSRTRPHKRWAASWRRSCKQKKGKNTGEKAKVSSPVLFGSFRTFRCVGHGVGQAVDPHFDPHHFQRFCNKKAPKTAVFDAFCRVSSKKMPFVHHLLYRSEILFLISGVITFLYCCAISQNWVFSSSITSFFSHRVLNKVGFPPRKIYRLLSGI